MTRYDADKVNRVVEDLKRFLNDDDLSYSTKQRLQYHLRLLYESGCLDHLLQ